MKKLILVLLLLLLILGFQLQFGLTEAANKESENQCKVIKRNSGLEVNLAMIFRGKGREK
ncbi:hypothetical protein WD019_06850 [Fictibacillus sp. Mic-4]|uniref:hypothetical protein n=1 Tax=Fictibacillus sp. Mic-4 TaxID=3132826 RepID=UPI003CE7A2FF